MMWQFPARKERQVSGRWIDRWNAELEQKFSQLLRRSALKKLWKEDEIPESLTPWPLRRLGISKERTVWKSVRGQPSETERGSPFLLMLTLHLHSVLFEQRWSVGWRMANVRAKAWVLIFLNGQTYLLMNNQRLSMSQEKNMKLISRPSEQLLLHHA